MRARKDIIVMLLLSFSTVSFAQKEAVVIQNRWSNDLNDYNPRPFFDNVFALLADYLNVKKVVEDKSSLITEKTADQKVKEKLKEKIAANSNAYYVTLDSELQFPVINFRKLIFKNPTRSSRFVFSFHVFDNTGNELAADTIVNNGCILRAINEQKGRKDFYDSFKSFTDDMQCHTEAIKERLQEKKSLKGINR